MDDFARVREAVDLVEVVSRHVELKRAGARMVGCCPFHAEKSPSFGIPIGQSYFKCFGCGKGGDVFTFLSEHLRISRGEALRQLAEEKGITLERLPGSDSGQREARERALRVLAAAQELFRKALASTLGEEARALLERRKLAPATIDAFGLGFAPIHPTDRFRSAVICDRLVKAGHRREDIVAAGIGVDPAAGERVADGGDAGGAGGASEGGASPAPIGAIFDSPLVRGRITFPIRDERGRIIAYGSRRLRDEPGSREPKYINSRETLLFSKSRVLYGLDLARTAILREDRVVLVEGYMDVILAHQGGLPIAIAALGTAVTPEHAKHLARMAKLGAVLFLDSDEAGQRAAERAAPILLAEKLDVRVLVLRTDKDPGDFFARGADRAEFDRLLQQDGLPAIEFLIERNGGRAARGIDERIQVARRVGAALTELRDPLGRAAVVAHLARSLDLPAEGIATAMAQARGNRPARRAPEAGEPPGGTASGGAEGTPATALESSGTATGKVLPEAADGSSLPMAQVLAEEDVLTALLRQPGLRVLAGGERSPLRFGASSRARLFDAVLEADGDDPATVTETLLSRFASDPATQQTLTDLLSRPVSAEPGALFDGAWRWFTDQRKKEEAERCREHWKGALANGDPAAAIEFLRQYQQLLGKRGRE
ncbi:MAG: toprim domain-containing protein [Planctomycetes bacterium]|nr:toprim domain-containing protein [Planctomycetota bacterium]